MQRASARECAHPFQSSRSHHSQSQFSEQPIGDFDPISHTHTHTHTQISSHNAFSSRISLMPMQVSCARAARTRSRGRGIARPILAKSHHPDYHPFASPPVSCARHSSSSFLSSRSATTGSRNPFGIALPLTSGSRDSLAKGAHSLLSGCCFARQWRQVSNMRG